MSSLDKTAELTTSTEKICQELDEDTNEFLTVGINKMSNLCAQELVEYKASGSTPKNKPLSNRVDLARSKPLDILREQFKLLQQELELNTHSSPRKRKTSDETASSGRSSTESIQAAPAAITGAAKKPFLNSKENSASNNYLAIGPYSKHARSRSPNEVISSKLNKENQKQPTNGAIKKAKSNSNLLGD